MNKWTYMAIALVLSVGPALGVDASTLQMRQCEMKTMKVYHPPSSEEWEEEPETYFFNCMVTAGYLYNPNGVDRCARALFTRGETVLKNEDWRVDGCWAKQ